MNDEIKISAAISLVIVVIFGSVGTIVYLQKEQTNACLEKQAHRSPIEARFVCTGQK